MSIGRENRNLEHRPSYALPWNTITVCPNDLLA